MNNHTPAPWIVSNTPDTHDVAIVGNSPFGGGVVVCYLADWGDIRNAEDKCAQPLEADANLIAAAPDLLEALKAQERLFNGAFLYLSEEEIAKITEQRRAAIAKAEGKI